MRAGRAWPAQAATESGAAPTGSATTTASGNATGVPDASNAIPTWVPEAVVPWVRWVPGYAMDTVEAVVVLLAAYFAGKLLVRLLGRRIARQFERPSLTRTVIRGIRVGVFVLAFLTILGIYGHDLGDIGLSVAVFSAVVGVVLAPIVGSFIGGVFLLADQPYEIGDMIEIADAGHQGFVEDITLRYTKIFTLDNTFIVIPNGTIRERDVVNYSAEDTRTRLSLDVLVTYESDVEAARSLIENAARKVDVVIEGGPDIRVGGARYPAKPTCYVDTFADHGVRLRLRYWITEPYKLLAARSAVQSNVFAAMADADFPVEIAYPHSHLIFDETSGRLEVGVGEGDAEAASVRHGVEAVEPASGDGTADGGGDGNGAADGDGATDGGGVDGAAADRENSDGED